MYLLELAVSQPLLVNWDPCALFLRNATHAKLAQLSDNFVQSLRASASAFPVTLVWLLGQLATHVSTRLARSEVLSICADFIFSRFISSAICEPERYGITGDFAISKVARHNLMQISKVVQVRPPNDSQCYPVLNTLPFRFLSSDPVRHKRLLSNPRAT